MVGTSVGLTLRRCPISSHISQHLLDRPTEPGASHPGSSLTSFCCAQRPLPASGLLLTQAGDSPVSSAPLSSGPTFNQVTRSEHVPTQCPSAFSSGRFPLTFLQPSLGSLMTWISSHQAPLAQPPDASRQLLQTSSSKAHPSESFPRQSLPTDMHSHVDTLTDVLTYIHSHSSSHRHRHTHKYSFIHSPGIHSHTETRNPSCTFLHTHTRTCTHTRVPTHSSTEASAVPTSHTDAADTDNGDFSPNENCSGQADRI